METLTYANARIDEGVMVLPNVWMVKAPLKKHRISNSYAILHNREALLIDCVREENKKSFEGLKDEYEISGLVLTSKNLVDEAFMSMDKMCKWYGEIPIFLHPFDTTDYVFQFEDPTKDHEILADYNLKGFHFAGHTSGSTVLYSPEHGGTIFCGDAAVATRYGTENNIFVRPGKADIENDKSLNDAWVDFNTPVRNILPLHGQPAINLTKEQNEEILNTLRRPEPTTSL